MNRKYRKTIVAGNWKMHKTATETKLFAERLKGALPRVKRCSIVLCVPYVDIPAAVKILKDSRVAVGAQNLHWETSGPYTGEVSAAMLADLDVKYVIIGHSERRALFGETDLTINKNSTPPWTQACAPSCAWGRTWSSGSWGSPWSLSPIS